MPEDTSNREIRVSREYDAPRDLAWEAMTKPEHIARWWGPRGFTTVAEVMDVRPGGEWRHVMVAPDGTRFPNYSVFTEVVKPERIVFSQGGHREGDRVDFKLVSTWTFEALAPKRCRVTVHMVFPTAGERDMVVKDFGAIEGAKETLARLAELMASGLGA